MTPVTERRAILGAILAGGRSRRFGSPKALARLGNQSLLDLVVESHRGVVDHLVIVANDPDLYAGIGIPRIADERPNAGPLGGLHASLVHASRIGATGVLVTPCDVPFIGRPLLAAVLAARDRADVVLVASPGPHPFEPLVGWYSLAVHPLLNDALASNDLALHRLVGRIGSLHIISPEEEAFGPDLERALLNINTPDDLELARAHLARAQRTTEDR